jgi:hypothetical protein
MDNASATVPIAIQKRRVRGSLPLDTNSPSAAKLSQPIQTRSVSDGSNFEEEARVAPDSDRRCLRVSESYRTVAVP